MQCRFYLILINLFNLNLFNYKLRAFLYPCRECGGHFRKLLDFFPMPKNVKRKTSIKYICDLHNQVNSKLNKPIFDCDKAAEYWGGDCGCKGK
jgi:hypothetical protein